MSDRHVGRSPAPGLDPGMAMSRSAFSCRALWLILIPVLVSCIAVGLCFRTHIQREWLRFRLVSCCKTGIVPRSDGGFAVFFRGDDDCVAEGMAILKSSKKPNVEELYSVHLVHPYATDRSVLSIRGCVNARRLQIESAHVTNTGMECVADLVNLKQIFVTSPRITSAGLEPLVRLPELVWLSLCGTEVDDTSVHILAKMSRLEGVELSNTRVTKSGVAALRAVRPDLTIGYSESRIEKREGKGDSEERTGDAAL